MNGGRFAGQGAWFIVSHLKKVSMAAQVDLSQSVVIKRKKQHKVAYENAIKGKVTVGLRVVRFNNIGLPRSGKTSFRKRLMGLILNILQAKLGKEEPSTGVAECDIQIIRNMCSELGIIVSKEWSLLKDETEEATLLSQLIYHVMGDDSTDAAPLQDIPVSSVAQVASKYSCESRSIKKADDMETKDIEDEDEGIEDEVEGIEDENEDIEAESSQNISKDEDIEEIFSLLTKAMKENDWVSVKHLLDDLTLIINTDTGGHAELLDLHGSLVSGPSLNLLFRRLVDRLDSLFKVYYTDEEGRSTEKEDSTMTVEEVMYQALASIASFGTSLSDDDDTSATIGHSKSKVMIVGTHRDLVSDEEFKEMDDILKKKIESTVFYEKDLVLFESVDQLMFAVDNRTGGQDEIDRIRRRLEKEIEENFDKIEIPIAWLVLSLCIRKTKLRTMSLSECEKLAGKLNITPEELPEALWFLHHCVGLLLYYPELEALKHTVICDIQVVFDSASNLIKNTFTIDKVNRRLCMEFKEKGRFSLKDVKTATSRHTDNLLPLQKLVKLLEHLCILTPLPLPPSTPAEAIPEPTYFMPCILQSARASELTVTRSDSDPAPLMLRYECGYVPVGVFPAMLTNLVSQQRELGWEMVEKGLRKNRVQFKVGEDYDIVTLISHPRYFEIVISRNEGVKAIPTTSLCSTVLQVIESTHGSVTSRMNYNFSMGYCFGFECPVHRTRDHLCILASKTSKRMECLQDEMRQTTFPLEKHHSVWFQSHVVQTPSNSESKPTLEYLTTSGILHTVSPKWKTIGLHFGQDMADFQTTSQQQWLDNDMCCASVFRKWIDNDGHPPNYPLTWKGLYDLLVNIEHCGAANKLKEEKRI